MTTCAKCNTPVRDGQRHCASCYSKLMVEYNQDMTHYQNEMAKWNSLSPQQKAQRHRIAEIGNVRMYSAMTLGFIWVIAFLLYLYLKDEIFANIDSLYMLGGFTGAAVAFILMHIFLKKILGRLFRGLFRSLLGGALFAAIAWLLTKVLADSEAIIPLMTRFFPEFNNPLSGLIVIGFGLGFILGILMELTGMNNASGKPSAPRKPSR